MRFSGIESGLETSCCIGPCVALGYPVDVSDATIDPAKSCTSGGRRRGRQGVAARRRDQDLNGAGRPRTREVEDAVRDQGVEVDVQVDGAAEALGRQDRSHQLNHLRVEPGRLVGERLVP